MKRRLLILNLIMFSALGVSGCVKYNGVPQEEVIESPIKLTLSVESLNMVVGDGGKTFSVNVSSEEVEIKDNKVTIENSAKDVVEIDNEEVESDAKVRVKALKDGDATLTITSKQDANAKATLAVKVASGDGTIRVESVAVTNKTINLKVGQTAKLEYVVAPENASNKDVAYNSDNKTCVDIDTSGTISALAKTTSAVKVYVTTKDGGKQDFAEVTVVEDDALIENNFYLIGEGAEFGSWTKANIKKKYELSVNPSNEGEYMVNFEATDGQEVKVVRYHKDSDLEWFNPDPGTSGFATGISGEITSADKNIKLITGGKFTLYFKYATLHDGNIVECWVDKWISH